ncbi:MAG: hypothetical protein E7658_02895 [Ruminococcaceae bacterium]|nr:hypothetical protein [Oscillospiraceae bacterium]
MYFKKNKTPTLSKDLFKNPTSEYRGAPFWAWNSKLEEKELLFQIEAFKKMGFGGFNMHARSGLDTEYLGEDFMNCVKACVKKAKKEEMLAWLYDEDRWPSGFAGGLVTEDKKYRNRFLVITARCPSAEEKEQDYGIFDIVFDENNTLASYRKITDPAEAEGEVWYVFEKINTPSPRFNDRTYADTLNPEAVRRFIDVTHEAYKKEVGREFDKTIPVIFTDEPQYDHKYRLGPARGADFDILLPWTDDFPDTYEAEFGESILDKIPELIWNLPGLAVSTTRYHYHMHVGDRFVEAYVKQCGEWCEKNHIGLAGHMMNESNLHDQTNSGEAMAAYGHFHIPGVDNLATRHEFNTLKQCQSAVRQYGKEGMMSELYGITSWDFDFREYKMNGDWQAAMGVTVRVPHLAYLSMEGESKRDYPPSIGYQSPWYEKFSLVEDHFARLSTALGRGKPVVHVAVIHPLESYWLHYGPREQSELICRELEKNFENINEWLTFGGQDFDYICETTFPGLCRRGGNPLQVGEMSYDAVIVPACITLCSTTLRRLEAFAKAGGKLIFMGEIPGYVDAIPSDLPAKLAKKAVTIPFSRSAILRELEDEREIEFRGWNGAYTDDVLYQMRQDGENRWLYFCRGKDAANKNLSVSRPVDVKIKGKWTATLYDTMTGETRPQNVRITADATSFKVEQYEMDSFLFLLTPSSAETELPAASKTEVRMTPLTTASLVPYSRNDPNVLLLDMAEYALNDDTWQPREEIIRIDTICREKLGFPEADFERVQPWCVPAEPAANRVKLRFRIMSDIRVFGAKLALEKPGETRIVWNGDELKGRTNGYFTDHSIKTIRIPVIRKGENILELTVPFSTRMNLEWCYLIGDFGVQTIGSDTRITSPAEKLGYGNIVPQTLPFFSGTLDYHLDITVPEDCDGENLELRIPQYKGSLISVFLDGKEKGEVIYPPYRLSLGKIKAGKHRVTLRLYVPRINSFGPVHFADETCVLYGPDVWRTTGDRFSYEYRLKEEGILTCPELWCEKV